MKRSFTEISVTAFTRSDDDVHATEGASFLAEAGRQGRGLCSRRLLSAKAGPLRGSFPMAK